MHLDITLALAAGENWLNADQWQSFWKLLGFVSISLGVSTLCSVFEAVLLSSSRSHIELLVRRGSRAGILMKRLKQEIEKSISAILTLNTIAHTVGAAGAGAAAVETFGSAYQGLFMAVLTLLILMFSEIMPKTLGTVYWKKLLPVTAYSILWLTRLLYPVVTVCHWLGGLIKGNSTGPTITRSEIEIMARISRDEGALDESEMRIIRNLLHLEKAQVKDILTPRTVTFALQRDQKIEVALEKHSIPPHSRIPIFESSLDDTTGYVLRFEVLKSLAKDEHHKTLKEFERPLKSVPETLSVAKLLELAARENEHIFLVVDEFGGSEGVVTLEDAIESLLGMEITDESDLISDMRKLAASRRRRYHGEDDSTAKP